MGEKWDKFKKEATKALIKAEEVLAEPALRKTSKFTYESLKLLSEMSATKGIVSKVLGGISFIDVAIDSFEVPYISKTEHFARSHKLIQKRGDLPKILLECGIDRDLLCRTVSIESNHQIREMFFDDESKLYFVESIDSANRHEPYGTVANSYYHTPNFNFNLAFSKIWDKFPKGAFLSTHSHKKNGLDQGGGRMSLCELSINDCMYLGDINAKEFSEEISKFREENISRSYMLAGDPGTGKTSFVIEVSKFISNRIIRIDPSVVSSFSSGDLEFFIENLAPDIVLFDDFDRATMSNDCSHILFLLENLKAKFPKIVIFATVNYFSKLDKAITRPGRFDEIKWFDQPGIDIRKAIAESYMLVNGISDQPNLAQEIAEKTEGLSPVYIKELCIRLKHKGISSLDSIISEFKRSINSKSSFDDDDDDFELIPQPKVNNEERYFSEDEIESMLASLDNFDEDIS